MTLVRRVSGRGVRIAGNHVVTVGCKRRPEEADCRAVAGENNVARSGRVWRASVNRTTRRATSIPAGTTALPQRARQASRMPREKKLCRESLAHESRHGPKVEDSLPECRRKCKPAPGRVVGSFEVSGQWSATASCRFIGQCFRHRALVAAASLFGRAALWKFSGPPRKSWLAALR